MTCSIRSRVATKDEWFCVWRIRHKQWNVCRIPQPGRVFFYHLSIKYGCDDNMIFHLTPNSLLFFFCGFTTSHAHHNLRHPSITGVSMSHEWALIRDEMICVWGRYCSQRHTKTWVRPEGFVGDEVSRRPVLLKPLPLGSRKKNEMHFWHLPISERILCWKTERSSRVLIGSYLSATCPPVLAKGVSQESLFISATLAFTRV